MKSLLLYHSLQVIALCLLTSANVRAQAINAIKDQSRKTGPIYFIENKNTDAMLYTLVKQDGETYHYTICLYDLQKAQLIKQTEIAAVNEPNTDRLIGRMGDVFWVLADSLTGYNVFTLEPVVTRAMIESNNPFMQNNFSALPNNYLLDEAAPVLYITTEKGEQYKLYPDLSMKPDNTSSDLPADENFSYEFAAEYKVNDKYELKYALSNVDTFSQHLYILGSEKETGQVLSYYGTSIYADNEEMRKLTIIPYNIEDDKINYSTYKPVTINKQYFHSAFLLKKFFLTTWHGAAGEKIILHEKEKNLVVALIDKDGNQRWNINTQHYFNNFIDYLINDKYFIAWFIAKEGEVFVAVDLQSGSLLPIDKK